MTDFKITIDDQDALDAINAELQRIQAAGTKWTLEQYLSDFCTTQHVLLREGQLVNAAQAKAQDDPDLAAFRAKKAAKQRAEADAQAAAAAIADDTMEQN